MRWGIDSQRLASRLRRLDPSPHRPLPLEGRARWGELPARVEPTETNSTPLCLASICSPTALPAGLTRGPLATPPNSVRPDSAPRVKPAGRTLGGECGGLARSSEGDDCLLPLPLQGEAGWGSRWHPTYQSYPHPQFPRYPAPDISTLAAGSRRTAVGSLVGGDVVARSLGQRDVRLLKQWRPRSGGQKPHRMRRGAVSLIYQNHEARLAACRSLYKPQAQARRRLRTTIDRYDMAECGTQNRKARRERPVACKQTTYPVPCTP
ncbi:hypothetical protein ABIB57_005016 [Devosia sp. UYZn731]